MGAGVRRQAVVLGFGACVLVVSAWFFAGPRGVVVIGAGMAFGWLVRHVARPGAKLPASRPAITNEAEVKLLALETKTSSLRHDLRGILSPAYLTAERLLNNDDPAAKRAGEMMMKAVDRVSDRLNETKSL